MHTVWPENLTALKFEGFASNLVYLILAEFKFDDIAAQSCDIIE